MRPIFVSCCQEDAALADTLDAEIREAGFPTRQAMGLSTARDWSADIDAAIQDAMAVVVIVSSRTLTSRDVNYEWAFAMGSGVPVLPVLLDLRPADLPPRLSDLQWLDFSVAAKRPWERLIAALRGYAAQQREFTIRVPRNAPPVVRDAAQALESADAAERRSALDSLKQMNHPAAIELLAAAVGHPIPEVRLVAACELAWEHHDARAVPALIEALRCGDAEVTTMFRRIGPPAVPALIEVLSDRKLGRQQRRLAFLTLGDIGGSLAVQALRGYVRDADPETRSVAASALGATADGAAVPALREIMHDSDADVRVGVAAGLGRCGPGAILHLLGMLDDADDHVRKEVVCSLGEICASRPVAAPPESLVPRMIEALLNVLDDEYDQVRIFAAEALGKLGDARSVPGLIAALGRPGVSVHYVSEALKALGAAAGPALREALNDRNEVVRSAAVKLLAELGDPEDEPRVVEVMRDINADVRLAAIRAITYRQYRSQLILHALGERLRDPEEDVCREAIGKLGEIRNTRSVPQLIECLQVEALASFAADLLRQFGTFEARAALRAWRRRMGR